MFLIVIFGFDKILFEGLNFKREKEVEFYIKFSNILKFIFKAKYKDILVLFHMIEKNF